MGASDLPARSKASQPNRRVVFSQRFFDEGTKAFLEAAGCEVIVPDIAREHGDGHLDHAEIAALLQGAAGWIIGQAHVTRELMGELPDLLVLSRRGVGYDRIDVAAAGDLGKVVTIAAGGNDDAVADHTLALMLGLSRRLRETQALMSGGDWSALIGSDLNRKTIGIVGFGRIARCVIKRLSGFDATVLVNAGAHHADAIRAAGARPVDLPTLLGESDVVTLHAPLTPATRFMIDSSTIALMKRSAILINTSRGGLVEDAHLLEALRDGRLAAAGLDVFVSESDPSYRSVTDALAGLPNVLTTPHVAASSREALERTNMIAARNVLAVLDGATPPADCLIIDGRRPRPEP